MANFRFRFIVYFNLILVFFLALATRVSSDRNSSKNAPADKNTLKDPLTAMFYHVENTKNCGNNLQKFKIGMEPLWESKFETHAKKMLQFSKTLTEIIINFDDPETDFVKIQILRTFFYFLLSKTNNQDNNFENELFNIDEVNSLNNEQIKQKKSNIKFQTYFDPYVLGYGFVLSDQEHCEFGIRIPSESDLLTAKSVKFINDCNAVNILTNAASNDFFVIHNEKTFPESKNLESEFSNFKDIFASYGTSDDSMRNCNNWRKNLKNTVNDLKARVSAEGVSFSHDYLLQRLVNDKNYSSSLWCGPYYECSTFGANGKTYDTNEWVLMFSLPILDKESSWQGAITLKLKVSNLDLNQCVNGDPVVSNSHKCSPDSECVYSPSGKFKLGSYKCKCTKGYLNTNVSSQDGSSLETQYWLMKSMKNNSYLDSLKCLPCVASECCNLDPALIDNTIYGKLDDEMIKEYQNRLNMFWKCRKYNMTLRYCVLFVQVIFVLITMFLSIVVFYSRRNKIIKHSMWILLEIILFGALLLYLTLVIQYFEPTANTCIAIPWFRELGFTVVYGILNLRLYKILIEFQSRKAHCVQLKDKDILRILFFIIVCVIGYLTAWTLVDLDYANEGFSLVTNTSLKGYIQYPICKIKWWDYFIEIGEFLFICVGFYLLYCTRTAPSEFNERKFISLVIYSEGFVSTLLHIIKHSIYTSIHPDTIFVLYFIRCHSTVTIMLLFIFFTKLCFLFKPSSDEYYRSSRLSTIEGAEVAVNPDPVKFQYGISNNDFEVDELNLIDMDPEEIRNELKRLYTQIHIFKTKSLKLDNPHIQSKRRAHRKNRKLSNAFQKSHAKDAESCQVKTPDESICSTEANLPHSSNIVDEKDLHMNNIGNYFFQTNAYSNLNNDHKFVCSEDGKHAAAQQQANEKPDSANKAGESSANQQSTKVQFKK